MRTRGQACLLVVGEGLMVMHEHVEAAGRLGHQATPQCRCLTAKVLVLSLAQACFRARGCVDTRTRGYEGTRTRSVPATGKDPPCASRSRCCARSARTRVTLSKKIDQGLTACLVKSSARWWLHSQLLVGQARTGLERNKRGAQHLVRTCGKATSKAAAQRAVTHTTRSHLPYTHLTRREHHTHWPLPPPLPPTATKTKEVF